MMIILQQRAIRIIAGWPTKYMYGFHTSLLLIKFQVLKVEQLRVAQLFEYLL